MSSRLTKVDIDVSCWIFGTGSSAEIVCTINFEIHGQLKILRQAVAVKGGDIEMHYENYNM